MGKKEEILRVRNLDISFETTAGVVNAVRGVNLTVNRGETVAIVGESGSGKSVSAKAIMGILAKNGTIDRGQITFSYYRNPEERVTREILQMKKEEIRRHINGKRIAMVFQDPMTSLNPLMPVGKQIMEGMIWHYHTPKEEAYEKALELEPADAELYTTLGDVQERLGEVQEALQSYQKAIQIDPNYARAYNNRGVVYLSQMETEKALADHRKAVKLAGDRALYHVNVGIVLNRLERYSEAVTSCNKAIKLDPGYAKAYDIRADAYEGLEQTEKAERDWETYRSLTKKTEEEEDTPQA